MHRISKKGFRLWFDIESDFSVRRILRFLRGNPKRGTCQVPGLTALSVLLTRGSLSRVARNAFSSVLYTTVEDLMTATNPDNYSVAVHDTRLMVDLAAELGPHIRMLCMSAPLSSPFKTKIAKRCTGLRMLAFRPLFFGDYKYYPWADLPVMIAKWGPGLERLTLQEVEDEVIGPIAQHCENLRHLSLRSCSFRSTREIRDAWPNLRVGYI